MRRISFLSRVAFIYNICLLLVWLMRYLPAIPQSSIASIVIIGGLVLSFVINGLVNILYLIILLRLSTSLKAKPLRMYVPVWLATANFIFLIVQIYLVI